MKFWFNDFLDLLAESFAKFWTSYKKRKNPEYKESEKLVNRFRLIIAIVFCLMIIAIVIGFSMQAIAYFGTM